MALLLVGAWPAVSPAAEQRPRCLVCHPAHYGEQGGCADCHRGNSRTSRTALAHSGLIRGRYAGFALPGSESAARGRKLAEGMACRRCHLLGGNGTTLAANLDHLLQSRTPETIAMAIVEPALYMPDFRLAPRDRDDLVTAVLAGGLQAAPTVREPPQVVYFTDRKSGQENLFAKQCGACHKLLSARYGGLGSGSDGPNLSGLLTRFYPATFQGNLPWTEERLHRWLKNPRSLRPVTTMRPVLLRLDAWEQLLGMLAVPPAKTVVRQVSP